MRIELESKYFGLACKRIETAYQQQKLFDVVQADDKQVAV